MFFTGLTEYLHLYYHELSERIAVLEEKMNTSYERPPAYMANREADMDDWKADMGKEYKVDLRWKIVFGAAQIMIMIAIFGSFFAFLLILVGIQTR